MDGLMMRRHTLLARPLASPLTVTGATPLLMPGAVAKPMRKATFQISPVQSGSGDPSPSNVRPITGWTGANVTVSGHNVWDEEWESGRYNANTGEKEANASAIRGKNKITVKGNTTYYCHNGTTASYSGTIALFFDANNNFLTKINGNNNYLPIGNMSFTTPENAIYMVIYTSGTTYNNDISINYPSTFTTYTPYSGSTVSVEFPVMGKNLLDPGKWSVRTNNGITFTHDGEYIVCNGTATANAYLNLSEIKGFGTDRVRCIAIPSETYDQVFWHIQKNTGGSLNLSMSNNPAAGALADVTPDIGFTGYLQVNNGAVLTNYKIKFALIGYNSGENAPDYEPYTSTVYSGTVDPVTGEGVVTHKMVDLGSLSYAVSGNVFYSTTTPLFGDNGTAKYNGVIIGEIYKNAYVNLTNPLMYCICTTNSQATPVLRISDDRYSTAADFKTAMTGIKAVVELATPIPFTITPQTLTPPAGDAYIWADCGSSAEVTYMGKA